MNLVEKGTNSIDSTYSKMTTDENGLIDDIDRGQSANIVKLSNPF